MEEKMELLFEELDKEKEYSKAQKNSLFSNIHIEGIVLILLFLQVIGKSGFTSTLKLDETKSKDQYEKITKMNHLVKDIVPYFGYNGRSMLLGMESLLNVAENIYGINNGAHKKRAETMRKVNHPKKTLKVLEAVAPHLQGKSRDNVSKLLTINNKIERLQTNKNGNILKNGQEVIDILDMMNVKKATEMKNNINQIKALTNLLKG